MKKALLFAGALIMIIVALRALAGPPDSAGQAPDTAPEQTYTAAYTVGSQGDRVVVYRADRLYLRTDTPTSSLPRRDRERLAQGIEVYSDRELKELLEDLCS